MATSDLLNELQKDTFKAEGDLEKKLCTVVLNQLEDTSGDISGLAVKWWVLGRHGIRQGLASGKYRAVQLGPDCQLEHPSSCTCSTSLLTALSHPGLHARDRHPPGAYPSIHSFVVLYETGKAKTATPCTGPPAPALQTTQLYSTAPPALHFL